MREIFHLGPNEGDLPTGQCVLGTIGFRLSIAPCEGVKKYPAALGFSSAAPVTQTNGICKIIVQTKSPTKLTALWREHNFGVAGQTV